jgi:hypothetical protein
MPILSSIDQQNMMFGLVPEYGATVPTFKETLAASFAYVQDEELSISSQFYNEGYFERKRQLEKLSDEGFDTSKYTDLSGIINYDRISRDTDGLIKTDLQLYQERNAILKSRREQNQDVIERGSGLAQFFGMTAGYMTDPVNIATLPIGGVATAGKGLSILAQSLKSARNTAAVAVASEAAIQPLVYKHKQDIDSPYDTDDALRAIAFAAGGSAILGGALGGISGYLRKLTEDISTVANVFPEAPFAFKPTVIQGKASVAPTFENINNYKAQLITEEKAKRIGLAGEKLTRGERKNINKELKELQQQLKTVEESELLYTKAGKPLKAKSVRHRKQARERKQQDIKAIQEKITTINKTLEKDRKASAAEASISRLEQGILPELAQKKLDDFILQKTTPEKESMFLLARMADNLRAQKGFRAEEVFLGGIAKVMDDLPKIFDGTEPLDIKAIGLKAVNERLDEMKKAKANANDIATLENIKNRIINDEGDGVQLVKDIKQENIELDFAILKENEAFRKQIDNYTISPDAFVGPPKPPAPKAKTTGLERNALDSDGMGKNFDEDMANYNNLETKYAIVDGQLVDATKVIKELDDDLEGLESIMRCSIG